MRRRPVRSGLALACCAALLLASDAFAAASNPRSSASRTTRVVKRDGYDSIRVSCKQRPKHSTKCTWNAVRKQSVCDGTAYVTRKKVKGRYVRTKTPSCREVLFGFNTYTNDITMRLQNPTGATVQRMFARWSKIEPSPGYWSWRETDKEYKLAEKSGKRLIVVANSTPCWARLASSCLNPIYTGPPDRQNDARWREFVRRLAERYPNALAIEIWNEQNLAQLWSAKANPERYTELLKQSYETIKAQNPKMTVISGGLLADDIEGESIAGMGDRTFMRRMLAAGAGNYVDAFGVHPYPAEKLPTGEQRWNPAKAQQTVEHLHDIATEAGFGDKPFWITEVGESTATQSGFPAAVTPEQQGADLVQIMRTAVRSRIVPIVVVHTLGDYRADAGQIAVDNLLEPATGIAVFYNGVGSGFGVFNADLEPKPAACAIARELGGSLSC